MKYTTVKISGIIVSVARTTDLLGYTEGVIECFLPEAENMTGKEIDAWTETNNKMMVDICALLNKKY